MSDATISRSNAYIFARNFIDIRDYKGISPHELGRRTGMSREYIVELEITLSIPSSEELLIIANALGVSTSCLTEDKSQELE